MDKIESISKPFWKWLFVVPFGFMTTYNIWRQEMNPSLPPLIEIVKDWHWSIWLLLSLLMIAAIVIEGSLRYNKQNGKRGSDHSVKSEAQHGGIVAQNISGSSVMTADGHGKVAGRDIVETHYHVTMPPRAINTYEQENTKDFEDYKKVYKGHRVKEDETWESISEEEYGNTSFVKNIQDANNGMVMLPPPGSIISIPTAILLKPEARENGKYVSLKVTTNRKDVQVSCKAIMKRLERFKEEEARWSSIDKGENPILSWHEGGY